MSPRGVWLLAVALVAAACGWGVWLTGSPWALLPLALPFVRVPWGDEDGEGTMPEDADRKRAEVERALDPRVLETRRAAEPPGAVVEEDDDYYFTRGARMRIIFRRPGGNEAGGGYL